MTLKGRKKTEEHKRKIGESNARSSKKGDESFKWKGGRAEARKRYYYGGKGMMAQKAYRVRMRKASGSHTFGEWENLKIQYDFACLWCGKKEPDIKLTEDHIIPLSKGGSDNIENIQPLCQKCNSRKHTKIIDLRKQQKNKF